MVCVYSRLRGRLVCHIAHTDDVQSATDAVARRFNDLHGLVGCSSLDVNMRLGAIRWSFGPFLAVVPGEQHGQSIA